MKQIFFDFSKWLINKLLYRKMNKEEIMNEWQRDHGQDFNTGISDRTFHRYLNSIPDVYNCHLVCDTNNENRYHLEFDKEKYNIALNMRMNALFLYSLGIDPEKLRQVAAAIQDVAESDEPEKTINNFLKNK